MIVKISYTVSLFLMILLSYQTYQLERLRDDVERGESLSHHSSKIIERESKSLAGDILSKREGRMRDEECYHEPK